MKALKSLIWRHRRENLRKCSLTGLENHSDLTFFVYPADPYPEDLTPYLLLTLEGEELSARDGDYGLIVIDGSWNNASRMVNNIKKGRELLMRQLPRGFRTAYPRRATGCPDEEAGLASVEALYIAHWILGRNVEGLLDHYYWKNAFLSLNQSLFDLLDPKR